MNLDGLSRKDLSEEDIKFRYITPAVENAGWSKNSFRFEFYYTAGKINVREGEAVRGKGKKVDYLLFYNTNTPLAVVEAKDANHEVAGGLQQAIDYARDLDVKFAYSSNGDGFYEHDIITGEEREIKMGEFPSPDDLWARYRKESGFDDEQTKIITEPYYYDASYNIEPRYYQRIAINRTVEAVAKGQKRILLVMATGTGKTFTAFQIVHRLKRSGKVNRVLYLADRNILIDQTLSQDFKPFKKVAVKVENRKLDSAYEIYMSLYHQLSDTETDYYKQFSPDFFDLIIVDECHRSSARDDSNWHNILEYFNSAIQIGMTATPKETEDVSNIGYFGDPIYTYSLKQGIEDGYLAPYEVIKVGINKDLEGYRPEEGKLDVDGYEVIDREYTVSDFDKDLIIDERTQVVAKRITEYLKSTDRMSRTIVFCVDTEHALRMRNALAKENADMMAENPDYVVRITGDDKTGKLKLDDFIDKNTQYPVIATTSMLLSTGVDTKTVKLIVLDKEIGSMTEFKQIIGRGTRLVENKGKKYFTIMDFRQNAKKFADPEFDGEAEKVVDLGEGDDIASVAVKPKIMEEETVISGDDYFIKDKVRINGVDVKIVDDKTEYYGANGKLVSESIEAFSKRQLLELYPTKDEFVKDWQKVGNKINIYDKLAENGVMLHGLRRKFGSEYDEFDVLLNIAYGMDLITKEVRTNKAKTSEFYNTTSDEKRRIIDELLDIYEREDISELERREILQTRRFEKYGGAIGVVRILGGISVYQGIIDNIESALYS